MNRYHSAFDRSAGFFGVALTRRLALRAAGGALVLALGPRGAARAGQEGSPSVVVDPESPFRPFFGETWVGPTADPETLVALVAEATDSGAGPRPARAYLCAGPERSLWFAGTLDGDRFDLAFVPDPGGEGTPLEPPTLTATFGENGVTGEAMLADPKRGVTLSFAAVPAEGIAGLYVAERAEDGTVTGIASTGATLTARQEAPPGTPGPGGAPYRIVGTVSLPDGTEQPIAIPARSAGPASGAAPAPAAARTSWGRPSTSDPTARFGGAAGCRRRRFRRRRGRRRTCTSGGSARWTTFCSNT